MKKYLIPALLVVGLVGTLGLSSTAVFADTEGVETQGRFRQGLEDFASFLGLTTENLQAAKEEGKTMQDVVEEQGKTMDEVHEYKQSKAVERWQEKGLSEEEINERLEKMAERRENCDGEGHEGSPFGAGMKGKGLGIHRE